MSDLVTLVHLPSAESFIAQNKGATKFHLTGTDRDNLNLYSNSPITRHETVLLPFPFQEPANE